MLNLTATELPRFMICGGSRLLGGSPPFDPDDTITKEGNACHWLVEQDFNNVRSADELIDRRAPNGVYITPDMVDHASEYLSDLRVARAAGCYVWIETDTSHGQENLYRIGGRADAAILTSDSLIIPDFKYGWKPVEPFENWTLMSHAISILLRMSVWPTNVILKIYQPRPFHPEGPVREWRISSQELMGVYYEQLKQKLQNPEEKLQTSAQCYKCPSMSQCPAAQIAAMNAVDVAYRAFNSNLSNDDLSEMIDRLTRAQEILKQSVNAYEDLAMHRLRVGQQIPNYSAQNGLGQTKWKDGTTYEMIQALTGIDASKKKLGTPNQAKKAGVPEEIVAGFTERPSTGFKLIREDAAKKAERLFGKKEA